LEIGDVIRLGSVEYRVLEYQDDNLVRYSLLGDKQTSDIQVFLFIFLEFQQIPFTTNAKNCEHDKKLPIECRICFRGYKDTPELLVDPCDCKDFYKYVHLKCLQAWISSKLNHSKNPNSSCYYWRNLNCEICKVRLPYQVLVDNQIKEIVPIIRPNNVYIILERVLNQHEKSEQKLQMMVLLDIPANTKQINIVSFSTSINL
jgi:RING-variant domain